MHLLASPDMAALSINTLTFWSWFNHQSCFWSHQQRLWEVMKTQHRVCKKLGHKNKETKEKCSFVVVSSQSAAPAFSGCGWCLSWGALSDPPLLSVHDLSCRGPGCSERCHSLLHRHRPRFRRTTRQTAAASHKRNSLKDSGEGYKPRHNM